MRLLVLTNNAAVADRLKGQARVECLLLEGLMEVLAKCKAMLDDGWKLECDPLAGYISRPIPYHTLLLSAGGGRRDAEYLRDMAAVDLLINRYIENRDWYELHSATPQRRADHGAVDCSIALRTISIALENEL